jgi:hypothetical protein
MFIKVNDQPRAPRYLRGSVVVNRRRCGKPTCRCATGAALHETTVLSYSEAGRTKFVPLRPEQVAAVRAAVGRYRAAQAALEEKANAALAGLVEVSRPKSRPA